VSSTPPVPRRRRVIAIVTAFAVFVVFGLGLSTVQAQAAMSGNHVARGVHLDDRDLGGLQPDATRSAIDQIATAIEARPVTVVTPNGTATSTAGALGVALDRDAAYAAVMAADKDGGFFTNIGRWIESFGDGTDVSYPLTTNATAVETAITELLAANHTDPVEPGFTTTDVGFTVTPPADGQDLDPQAVANAATDAVRTGERSLTIDVAPVPVAPRHSEADAQSLADQAGTLTVNGLTVQVADKTATVPAATVRSWLRLGGDEGALKLTIDRTTVLDDVRAAVGAVGTPAVDVGFAVNDSGGVDIVDGTAGTQCCAPDSAERIDAALAAGTTTVRLDLEAQTPPHDRAWAEALGVNEVVGTFTTRHPCCEPRVTNIHKIADIVRGMVIEPGDTFSVNERVGKRTAERGFVNAPVIYNATHDEDVGGGVSQFATTTFNAAFFAGLDIPAYQAHTLYISRYPYGREATISWPEPDLKIKNNTPFGVLIWTSYTNTSLTITLYSTPYVKGEQTGQTKTPGKTCDKVVTERTRTWFGDGHTETDNFVANYQYNDGVRC
jgi:vancomycin resistance protein YoaR